ncbi:kelch repeat and BTB domain-containing protein 13 [Pseudoliparis swirei]|uniref:kelch repeat and BTB domain-containing protein 13 n=1 Tax=Pseudoliparis swirei TaxID=2059687 RepID=UPI0024BE3BBA|nr:kelch repeat and BTB domain-containing protein 13 [Pseudoliparis swirei]
MSAEDAEDRGRPPRRPSAKLTVVVGDARFSEDKAFLVQSCDYFGALFRSGMKECRQDEVHLQGLGARGFLAALTASRGEFPDLDGLDDLVEAVECAAFLQAAPLARRLVDLVDSDNCLLMYRAAAAFGLDAVYRAAALFIRNVYADLEAEAKESLTPELIAYVESLTPSAFVAVGAHASCGADRPPLAASRTVCRLDESANVWKVLTELPPEASTSMAGVAVLDNRLYVVGGVHGPHKRATASSFCYSVDTDAWSRIPGLERPRRGLGLVGADGRLYAIGGECDRTATASVEAYDVEAASWAAAASLPRPAAAAACAKAAGRIFACLWKPTETTEIYEYVSRADEWRPVATLIRRRSYGHFLVGHRDDLYVVRNGPADDFLRCLVDCYNLRSGQWSSLPGHFANSKGALFTAAVRGDSLLTLSQSETQEFAVADRNWKPRRRMKGFPRSGSLWTFLLRLPDPRPAP